MAAIGLTLVLFGFLLVVLFRTPAPMPAKHPRTIAMGFLVVLLGGLLFLASVLLMIWRVMP